MEEGRDRLRFSVVVPAYNEAAFLGATLEALAAQDCAEAYEVIVVDNASTDETAAVAAAHGVRVVYAAEPGVCAARQAGTEAARGEIVVSTDADTVPPRNWLSTIDARFVDPSVVAVAGPCRYDRPVWWSKAYPRLLFGLVSWVAALTGLVCYVSATNLALRRSAFPGYDLHLTQGGDELDLLRRLRRRGRVIFDNRNVVTTSARRLHRGLFYSVVVSFLFYYLLAYALNRLLARRAFGMAPAVRVERGAQQDAFVAVLVPRLPVPWLPPSRLGRGGVLLATVALATMLGVVALVTTDAVPDLLAYWRAP